MKPATRIGVDTGGTFTDLLALDASGLRVHKLRSTPADPSEAILAGIEVLSTDGPLEVTHGSTVATNAVLERKGARTALLTTAGFEDLLAIGRQTRPELYNLDVRRPEPLVPRTLTFGLPERITADGSILHPLDLAALEALIPTLRAASVESIALCLLHAYRNPIHEQSAAQILRADGFRVSASHEVLPEYREYERFATTAVNAYVAPLMAVYLNRLETSLHRRNPSTTLRVMQSNGGSISAARAASEAVQTILSGPAAGVVGAQVIARSSGYPRIVTFDMGGTSTDVSLVDGEIGRTSTSLVGDLPVALPVLDIHTVGAGGGSIAWIDLGGALRVGPHSAGASPGPACFGTGDHLTVTDANLLLGRLDPAFFLGGRMTLDLPRTQRLARALAAQLNLTPRKLAEGILRIANANMERAIRVVSVQRGFDPRDFALLAFGGAGGLHACELAASLDIATVLIPRHSGVLSALGMLLADVVKDYSASLLGQPIRLEPLIARAHADLAKEGFPPESITLEPTVAMRYKGQAFEIDIPLTSDLETAFHQTHHRLYGYSNPHRPTEQVQLRLRATGQTVKPTLPTHPGPPQPPPPPEAIRPTLFHRRTHPTPIYHLSHLPPGTHAEGPAILLTGESTNVIPPAWHWRIDPTQTLIATQSK